MSDIKEGMVEAILKLAEHKPANCNIVDITTPTHMMIDKEEAALLYHHMKNMWLDRDADYTKFMSLLRRLDKFSHG